MDVGDQLNLKIDNLAFGGHGVARPSGLTLFVPFTAKGDEIVAEVTQLKKQYGQGRLTQVLKPSLDRSDPFCPYFQTCGGCQLQHLNYDAQLEYKRQTVIDALVRIGQIKNPQVTIIASSIDRHYRRRIKLQLRYQDGGWQAGYHGFNPNQFVPISFCSLLAEKQHPLFRAMHELLPLLPFYAKANGTLTLYKDPHLIALTFSHPLSRQSQDKLKSLSEKYEVQIALPLKRERDIQDAELLKFNLEQLTVHYNHKVFVQNHPEQSLAIYLHLRQKALLHGLKNGIDLYCGVGATTLLLKQAGLDIQGVELSEEAVKLARYNAAWNQINASFHSMSVESACKTVLYKSKPQLVIANPPKAGLSESVIEWLKKSACEKIYYISCMPPTLARDLYRLKTHYKLIETTAFDMFAQTSHVESVAILERV